MHVLKQCDVPGQSKVGVGPLVALDDKKTTITLTQV